MSIKSKKSKGVSLVELMIGLFIASLISTSIYYLYGSGLRTFYQVESTSDLQDEANVIFSMIESCLLYTSPSPRDQRGSRMPSSA